LRRESAAAFLLLHANHRDELKIRTQKSIAKKQQLGWFRLHPAALVVA
jgi:hypothetical protein